MTDSQFSALINHQQATVAHQQATDLKFDAIIGRLDKIDQRLDNHNELLGVIVGQLGRHEKILDGIKTAMLRAA